MKEEYTSKNFDHLGIVSVICDEIGIREKLDSLIPPDPQVKMTLGECVKLMIINGLGFTSRPLYLEAQFFESRPVQRFLGRDCTAEINDDRLGRALDQCYNFGCDRLFAILASQAAIHYGVSKKFRHLDSTSMAVEGEYDSDDPSPLISFGYSKDHRPDLKQFMIYMVSSRDGDVPLLAQTVAGNSSDKKLFRERLNALKEQIQHGHEEYIVADSELYTKETLQEISPQIKWITRVPEKIVAAKELITSTEEMQEVESGYCVREVSSTYGEIEQRWLLVHSQQAHAREEKTLRKQIHKEFERAKIELGKLSHQDFDCEHDAHEQLKRWAKNLKYHRILMARTTARNVKQGRGRPRLNESVDQKYRIQGELQEDAERIDRALITKGRFIVATNELDHNKLSAKEMLFNYKEQQAVERGFRFLKDPFFMTSSVFLKSQERIMALGMVMCLCLLVYTIAQRFLRRQLEKLQTFLPNQLGKPTKRPTMRWIFQLFEGVHLLIHRLSSGIQERVLNMNKVRYQVLRILGDKFEKIYSTA
jgi:transposase